MSDRSYRRRVEELVFNKKLDESLDLTEGNKKTKEKLKAHLRGVGSKAQGLGTAHMKQGETNTSPSYLLRRGRAEAQRGVPTQEPMPGRITAIQYKKRKAAKKREDESNSVVGRDRILEIAKVEILSRAIVEKVETLYEQGKIDEGAFTGGVKLALKGVKRTLGAPFRAVGGLSHGLRGEDTPSQGSISHAIGRRVGSATRGLTRGLLGKEQDKTKSISNKAMHAVGDAFRMPFGKSQAQMKKKADDEAKKVAAQKAAAKQAAKQAAAQKAAAAQQAGSVSLVTSNDISSDYIAQKYERIDELLPFLLAAAPWVMRGVQAARLYRAGRTIKGLKTAYDLAAPGQKLSAVTKAGAKAAGRYAAGKGAGEYAADAAKGAVKSAVGGMVGDIGKKALGAVGSGISKGISGFKRAKGVSDYVGGDKEEKRKKETEDDTQDQSQSNQDDSYRY